MSDDKRRHIPSLDLVRAGSMVYIVGFWHLMNYVGGFDGYRNEVTARLTVIVLGTFTMLSGYLLGRKPVEPTFVGIGAFYRRRFLRIYPPLVVALIAFALLGITSWAIAIKSIFLVSLFSGPSVMTIWYVGMIALFYIVAPVLLVDRPLRLFGRPVAPWLAGGALFWLVLLGLQQSRRVEIEPRLAIYFPCFVAGLGLARWTHRGSAFALTAAGAAASIGCALSYGLPLDEIEMSLRSSAMAVFAAAFVMFAAISLGNRVSVHPAVAVLSYAAFFMYLAHRPVYLIASRLVPLSAPGAQLAFMLLVALPCVTAVSWAFQYLYDAALRRLGY